MGMNIPLSFGASGQPIKPGMRNSVYYPPVTAVPASSTGTATAGVLYFAPFFLPGEVVNRIAIEVTVGAGNARLGIYANDPTVGGPNRLLVDAGEVSATSVAIVEATFTDLTLPNDLVWAAALFSSTPTLRTYTSTNNYLLGMSTTSLQNSGARGLSASSVSYGALPIAAPTVASSPSFTGAPMIALRKV